MKYTKTAVAVGVAAALGMAGLAAMPSASTSNAELKSADGKSARMLQSGELNSELVSLAKLAATYQDELVVSGVTKLDYPYLQAKVLRFEPGAKLVISQKAQSIRPQSFLVVQKLVVTDPNNPGTITWEKAPTGDTPAAPGEAPAGPSGGIDGSSGSPGNAGGKGIPGLAGEKAPQLTLIVMSVPSAGVLVDLAGGDGNKGSPGQKGGHGGSGAKGSPASQTMFGCRAGGGNGGNAGPGGPGGTGGDGGTGGAGGTFLLVSNPENLPSLTQKFRVKVGPGQGGTGGDRGLGGDPGLAGPGGQDARPFCGGGNPGAGAGVGSAGEIGTAGKAGAEGDWTVGGATAEQFDRYVWPIDKMSLIDKLQRFFAKLF